MSAHPSRTVPPDGSPPAPRQVEFVLQLLLLALLHKCRPHQWSRRDGSRGDHSGRDSTDALNWSF